MQAWGLDLTSLFAGGGTYSRGGPLPRIHARLTLSLLVGTAGVVLGATLLLGLLPLRRLGRLPVVETLR